MSEQSSGASTPSDFIPVAELSGLLCTDLKTIYNQHSAGRGPLAPILTKLGGRLGCWREDYDAWKAQQRRLPGGEEYGATARAQSTVTPPAADSHISPPGVAEGASKARRRTAAAKSRRASRK